MNDLPKIDAREVAGKSVIVRVDAEIDGDTEGQRMKSVEEIAGWLVRNGVARLKVIGHGGEGQVAARLAVWWGKRVEVDDDLRRDEREKSNDIEMAKELARGFDVYVNDAFSVSHRKHTSMVALPKLMRDEGKKVFAGLRLSKELEVLDGVMSRQTKKLLVVGGAKSEDKAKMAIVLAGKFDRVLVGGVLAKAMRDQAAVTGQELPSNIVLGGLREDGLDLNEETMQIYVKAIGQAEVVVLAGPMGMYEQETSAKGTGVVFAAVAYGGAFKVAGGGNTEVALHKFGLVEKFDWVSVGGGAMLEYLAVGKLVAVEALIS